MSVDLLGQLVVTTLYTEKSLKNTEITKKKSIFPIQQELSPLLHS